MSKKTVLTIIAGLAVLAAFFFSGDKNRTALFEPEHRIFEGEKFGVYVGESETIALRDAQRDGWRFIQRKAGGTCFRHQYPSDTVLTVFMDDSWRTGALCVVSKQDRVVEISWAFTPFTPSM